MRINYVTTTSSEDKGGTERVYIGIEPRQRSDSVIVAARNLIPRVAKSEWWLPSATTIDASQLS